MLQINILIIGINILSNIKRKQNKNFVKIDPIGIRKSDTAKMVYMSLKSNEDLVKDQDKKISERIESGIPTFYDFQLKIANEELAYILDKTEKTEKELKNLESKLSQDRSELSNILYQINDKKYMLDFLAERKIKAQKELNLLGIPQIKRELLLKEISELSFEKWKKFYQSDLIKKTRQIF